MGLWTFLVNRRSAKQMAGLAAEIAERSHSDVWQRVAHRATAMRLVEARGYVRARAARVIHHHVHEALETRPEIDDARREELISLATEVVISAIARELLHLPQRIVPRRQAA